MSCAASNMLYKDVYKRQGEIPADKGVIVLNISTVSHLYRFIKTGMPLTHKRLTIDGNYVDKPMNVRVPIGTSIDYVLDFAGVDKSKADKILMGGPMMGIAIYDVETPVIKNNNAILDVYKRQVLGFCCTLAAAK